MLQLDKQLLENALKKELQNRKNENQRQYDFTQGRYPPYKSAVPQLEDILRQPNDSPRNETQDFQRTKNLSVSSFPKFVAGQTILERNPLLQPVSTVGTSIFTQNQQLADENAFQIQQQIGQRNYDLLNPDNQYLRYKHLLNSQYYNQQVNSVSYLQANQFDNSRYGESVGSTKKIYEIPTHFNLSELQQQQREQALKQLFQASDQINSDFKDENQNKQKLQSVTLYQLPSKNQRNKTPKPPQPEYYRSIYMSSQIQPDVIQALGGIQDSMKPLEQSLRQHELREVDVEPNYYDQLIQSQHFQSNIRIQEGKRKPSNDKHINEYTSRSEFLKKTLNDKNFQANQSKIVSASPMRKIIRRIDFQEDRFKINNDNIAENQLEEEQADFNRFQNTNDEFGDFERDENADLQYTQEQQNINYQNLRQSYVGQNIFKGKIISKNYEERPQSIDFEKKERMVFNDFKNDQNSFQTSDQAQISLYERQVNRVNESSQIMRQKRDDYLKNLIKSQEQLAAKLNIRNLNMDSSPSLNPSRRIRDKSRGTSPESYFDGNSSYDAIKNKAVKLVNGIQLISNHEIGDINIDLRPSPSQDQKNQNIRNQSNLLRYQKEQFLKNFQ